MRRKWNIRKIHTVKCAFCGKELKTARADQKFCNRKCYMAHRRDNPSIGFPKSCNKEISLCWFCKHTNQNECSWFTADMIPVPGWKAIERPVEGGMSYVVLECPNYEREEIKR